MKIINIKRNIKYLKEYIKLCSLEWGTPKSIIEMEKYVEEKSKKILNGDKVISILGIEEDDKLVGFISLFKYDGDERRDLTPWYATMYVKKEYRGKGYSKILNNAILKQAKELNYKKVYLKSNLINYYEKFGAIYIETLNDGEKLFYIDCI
ncbi:MAG: GNAT family N-acetyltransferase [bacterium]|nr:GNAT family N-acetyltransferase [bacterium]